jgi:hypothetical protein
MPLLILYFLCVENCSMVFHISFQNGNSKKIYQMHLKSSVGPIYVLLVNKDIDCTSPVAIEVPPPKSVLESSVKVLKCVQCCYMQTVCSVYFLLLHRDAELFSLPSCSG